MASKLYTKDAVEDLVLLEEINEDAILRTLQTRHKKNAIYTYIGNVLISVNPFKEIRGLYGASAINSYRGRYQYERSPHVYALSESAYRNLRTDFEDQCVIISGESGAGKTEASKKIMQYIAAVSGSGEDIERVKNQILQSNPVLEAFGNAKTVRNNNSSRFGKYMEIYFDYSGDPVGGRITNYLLEKSRVVQPAQNERNFHIFYQLFAGLDKSERQGYSLLEPQNYRHLAQSDCFTVKGIDDQEEFEATVEGMGAMGITQDEISEMISIVSAVMWIGNVEFKSGTGESSEVKEQSVVSTIAKLLGAPAQQVAKGLTSRTIQSGVSESINTTLNAEKASYTRDALAKIIYSRLFDWIVARINRAIDATLVSTVKTAKDTATIGVLDIYGFEIFELNSFEQFCINFVNEKLQQIFIEKTLKSEQEEYKTEGIEWVPVQYFNNKVVCDLIEKRPQGLFAYLDEECLLGKGTDMSFLEKAIRHFDSHAHFEIPGVKGAREDFLVKHYAGDVRYNVTGFIDKNKDLVWKDLLLIGEASQLSVMREMFPPGQAAEMGRRRPPTAGSSFVRQVNALMDTLAQCTPHYIRCIKPNDIKQPMVFQEPLVMHQIRYLGLHENVRVRRAGFAFRQTFTRFLQRYKMLNPQTWPNWPHDERSGCQLILKNMGMQEGTSFQLGKTKVFIRAPVSLFSLEELRERKLNDIVTLIQKVYRSYRARKYFLELREKALGLFGRNKQRRRISIKRYFVGDYLDLANDIRVQRVLGKNRENRIIFCDEVDKINNKWKVQRRVVLLSDKAMYNMGTNKYKMKRRVPIVEVDSISVSTKADNFVVIHVKNSWDWLIICERKTELLTALADQYRQLLAGQELRINFSDQITYYESRGLLSKSRDSANPRTLTFVEGKQEGVTHAADPKAKSSRIITVGDLDIVRTDMLDKFAPKKMTKGVTKKGRFGGRPGGAHNRGISIGQTNQLQQGKGRFQFSPPAQAAAASPPEQKASSGSMYASATSGPVYTSASPSAQETWARGIADFQGQDEQELSFNEGDMLRILSMEPDGWWSAEIGGKLGYVPKTYVEIVQKPGRNRGPSRPASRLPPRP